MTAVATPLTCLNRNGSCVFSWVEFALVSPNTVVDRYLLISDIVNFATFKVDLTNNNDLIVVEGQGGDKQYSIQVSLANNYVYAALLCIDYSVDTSYISPSSVTAAPISKPDALVILAITTADAPGNNTNTALNVNIQVGANVDTITLFALANNSANHTTYSQVCTKPSGGWFVGINILVFNNLPSNLYFHISAVAENAVGSSPVSNVKTSYVSNIPTVPVVVSATVKNDTTATLKFTSSSTASLDKVTTYTIGYGTTFITVPAVVNEAAGCEYSVDFSNLLEGASYTFYVRATNVWGVGPEAFFQSITMITAPSAPILSLGSDTYYGYQSIIVTIHGSDQSQCVLTCWGSSGGSRDGLYTQPGSNGFGVFAIPSYDPINKITTYRGYTGFTMNDFSTLVIDATYLPYTGTLRSKVSNSITIARQSAPIVSDIDFEYSPAGLTAYMQGITHLPPTASGLAISYGFLYADNLPTVLPFSGFTYLSTNSFVVTPAQLKAQPNSKIFGVVRVASIYSSTEYLYSAIEYLYSNIVEIRADSELLPPVPVDLKVSQSGLLTWESGVSTQILSPVQYAIALLSLEAELAYAEARLADKRMELKERMIARAAYSSSSIPSDIQYVAGQIVNLEGLVTIAQNALNIGPLPVDLPTITSYKVLVYNGAILLGTTVSSGVINPTPLQYQIPISTLSENIAYTAKLTTYYNDKFSQPCVVNFAASVTFSKTGLATIQNDLISNDKKNNLFTVLQQGVAIDSINLVAIVKGIVAGETVMHTDSIKLVYAAYEYSVADALPLWIKSIVITYNSGSGLYTFTITPVDELLMAIKFINMSAFSTVGTAVQLLTICSMAGSV